MAPAPVLMEGAATLSPIFLELSSECFFDTEIAYYWAAGKTNFFAKGSSKLLSIACISLA